MRRVWWQVLGLVLIRGEEVKTIPAGYVADFCPIDRGVQAGLLMRFQRRRHLHFVPIERGRDVGLRAACLVCETPWMTPPGRYGEPSDDEAATPAELLEGAAPEHQRAVRQRVELERRVSRGTLTAEQRATLVYEPFPFVHILMFKLPRSGRILAYVLLLLAFVVTLVLAPHALRGSRVVLIPLVIFLVVTVGLAYLALRQWRRLLDNEVLPRLVRALTPLQPTHEEISGAVQRMREQRLNRAKWIRVDELYDRLAKSTFRA